MNKYPKISNVFKFDAKFQHVDGFNEPYRTLANIEWEGTEKVDGTNVRIYWDGYHITLGGRTDAAQFQGDLGKYLTDKFMTQEMEYVFEQVFGDKEAYVFGEGYGPKIQAGGGLYSNEVKFIVFDVTVDGYELNRANTNDVAAKLGLDSVPVVFHGTLNDAYDFVRKHPASTINPAHEMEGLVLTPTIDLYNAHGNRIKCKCKYRDMVKAGLAD